MRFVDPATGALLDARYGRCDREQECAYFVHPAHEAAGREWTPRQNVERIPDRYVSHSLMTRTLQAYDLNPFAVWLRDLIGDAWYRVQPQYLVGTAKNAGTLFWQIDERGRVRTAQKIHYDAEGHRRKDIPPRRMFVLDSGYRPCLFGQHLLRTAPPDALICLVESEKTAVIAAAYMPMLNDRPAVWLATCGANGLTEQKVKVLSGRDVALVPDYSDSARRLWFGGLTDRLRAIGCRVTHMDPLPDTNDGSDLADLLVATPPPVWEQVGSRWIEMADGGYPKIWDVA